MCDIDFRIHLPEEHDELPVACGNCNWKGQMQDVNPLKNISARVSPGEIVPAGECPKCGALASLVNPHAIILPSESHLQAATHIFDGGSTTYHYWWTGKGKRPSLSKLKKQLDIDFEPDGETLDCEDINLTDIPTIR